MRGKVAAAVRQLHLHGITPAHAGKRKLKLIHIHHTEDHPRPCGEKRMQYKLLNLYLGSPPPMRGKDDTGGDNVDYIGITPAHAGKRTFPNVRQSRTWDHPRPCGEKSARARSMTMSAGSPPPMRGKVRDVSRRHQHGRITPAHAGKRRILRTARAALGDHPRPCGEKTKKTPKCRHFRFSNQPISFSFSYT